MRHLNITTALVLGLLSLSLACPPTWADDARRPSAREIVRKLAPKITVEGEDPPAPDSASIDLEVNFDYGSAELKTDARLILDRLGDALEREELRASRFKITGHTDTIGGEQYNLGLSRDRALSVRSYLVRRHHIDASRLEVEGKGFSELADPAHPTSAINRRVQVTRLAP
ncbi:OmpA family protein [Methylomagnum sp.]